MRSPVFLKVQHHGKGALIYMEVIKAFVFVAEGGDKSGTDAMIFLVGDRNPVFVKFYDTIKAVGDSDHEIRTVYNLDFNEPVFRF